MAHTHDGIDWPARIESMLRVDAIEAGSVRPVAERMMALVHTRLPEGASGPVVVDVGSGTGGMSVALAAAMDARRGGRLVLADAVPDLLTTARRQVTEAVGTESAVEVRTVLADAATDEFAGAVPPADLVWASRVVHHLPDQQAAVAGLTRLLRAGGWLALGEGGLATRCLPWDLGVGEPGLADRLVAARDTWFAQMRAEMPGAVRLPVGWGAVLSAVGLSEVTSFSYLVDLPAPASEPVRLSVVDWVAGIARVGADHLGEEDRTVVGRLLDPNDPAYVGARDDVYVLSAATVHLGRKAD